MIRKLKILGLALVAIAALSAVAGASGASASSFRCEKAPCIITGNNTPGEGNHIFKAGAEVICTDAEFKGTALNAIEPTQTTHPTYSNCTLFGEKATVETSGCNYVFSATTNSTGHLPVNIECTPGKEIHVVAPGCTLSFAEQETAEGVKATNLGTGSGRDVTVDATTKARFTKNNGALCFLVTAPPGIYTGNTTVQCFEDKKVTGNIDEGATYEEGNQVGCWWEA